MLGGAPAQLNAYSFERGGRLGGVAISGHGAFQVSNMMPPQRQHGAGHGIGSGLVVASPHPKQIHAVLCTPSSGPTIASGRPRRSMSSRSFIAKM
jgi:hypothetical protein